MRTLRRKFSVAVLFGASNEELFLVPSRLRFECLERVWCR